MSEVQKDSSGVPENEASGDTQEENQVQNQRKDVVKYETYQKVLSEKKKRDEMLSEYQQRLEELETANKQREEDELKKKENFKQLLEVREKELGEIKNQLTQFKEQSVLTKKAQAFLQSVGGLKKQEYLELVDFSKIPIDDDGQVDQVALESYRDEWKSKFPETLNDSHAKKVPNTSPKGGSSEPSRSEKMEKLTSLLFRS
jgi:galactokinase